uniref:F-box domain-containing protein n=1 Tax=Ditylenchus dipsaci TaxID=166011 RepID=A0A915EFD5_9BILA
MYLERNQDAKCVKENLIRLFRVACGGCWFKKGEADVYKPLTERFYCSAVCPFEIRLVKSNDGTAQEVTLEDGLHNSKCQNAEQTRVALRVWNLKKLPMEIIFDIFLFINYSCYLRILPILPSPLSQALRRTRQFLHFINRNMARVPEVLEKMDETKSKFLRKFRFSNDHEYQTFGVIYDILGSRLFVSCFDLINMPSTIGALVKEACEEKDLDEQAVQFYDLNAVAVKKEDMLSTLTADAISSNFNSQDFFSCLKQDFPNISITPKCHMLCCHVKEFMKLHYFWGMLSEQEVMQEDNDDEEDAREAAVQHDEGGEGLTVNAQLIRRDKRLKKENPKASLYFNKDSAYLYGHCHLADMIAIDPNSISAEYWILWVDSEQQKRLKQEANDMRIRLVIGEEILRVNGKPV